MNENKTSKYFKYAIGEIILVVIGILIALSINNWNEERKSADYTKLLFKKALQELQFNIEKANTIVGDYRGKDSIYYKVINKKATKDDYMTSGRYIFLLMSGELVLLSDEAFQKLINSEERMTQEQDSLLSKLKRLYSTSKAEVDIGDALLPEYIFGLHKKYKNEQAWYSDFFNFGIRNDEMINYFLSAPEFLNEVSYYKIMFLGQHHVSTKEFRADAIIRYSELCNYLNIDKDTSIVKDLTNYTHYIGTYRGDNSTIYIEKEANYLKYTTIRNNDSVSLGSLPLYLDSKTYFTSPRSFGRLGYDNNNEVNEIVFSNGARQGKFKKVKTGL